MIEKHSTGYFSPDEVHRKWTVPVNHPESWVQENATYKLVYNRTLDAVIEMMEKDEDGDWDFLLFSLKRMKNA